MKKIMFLMVFVALLVVPIASYAETKEECESKCIDLCHHWDNDEDFNGCMRVCMTQCKPGKPTGSHNLLVPSKSDLNNSKTCAKVEANEEIEITNLVIASLSDNDLSYYAAENGETVTVTGKLTQVFAIGGETTGWALILDQPLNIEGKELKLIEIDLLGKKINLFAFKDDKVKVIGNLVKRHGVERGSYWVIEVREFSW